MKTSKAEVAKQLRAEGNTIIQIARVLGLTRQRVYQLLDKQYNAKRRALYTGVYKMLDKRQAID